MEKKKNVISRSLETIKWACKLRPNYLGIVGGILAFISLVLPWWVLSEKSSSVGTTLSGKTSVYLYQARWTNLVTGALKAVSMNLWFGWTALALVVIGGLLSLAGSVITTRRRMLLALGGTLVLLSIIVFAAGLQNQISSGSLGTGYGYPPGLGLFSKGSYINYPLFWSISYSSYLSFGFWLALVAAILMFAALTRKPSEAIPPPPPPPPLDTKKVAFL
jgi:hypothetical protein